MYWRNPAAASFTFAFPLMFLVIFIAINGNDRVDLAGGTVQVRPVLRAGHRLVRAHLGVLHEPRVHGVASAARTALLKRMRGTPLSPVDVPRRHGRQRHRRRRSS